MKKKTIQDRILELTSGGELTRDDIIRKGNFGRSDAWNTIKKMCDDDPPKLLSRKDGRKTLYKTNIQEYSDIGLDFNFGFTFQDSMLKQCLGEIKKTKKPLFKKKKRGMSDYMPRTPQIRTDLDVYAMYFDNIVTYIARFTFVKAFDIMFEKDADERINKCQALLQEHVSKLLEAFPEEKNQIRRYYQSSIRHLEFKV